MRLPRNTEGIDSTLKCRAYNVNQVIHLPGCQNKTIENKYCSGQCFSSWEPHIKGTPKDHGNICSACVPENKFKKAVPLSCSDEKSGFKYVDVDIIKSCLCQRFPCKSGAKEIISLIR